MMTKQQFLTLWTKMYREANMADSDNPERSDWMHSSMAGHACCRPLDQMASAMLHQGMLTDEEYQSLYDNLQYCRRALRDMVQSNPKPHPTTISEPATISNRTLYRLECISQAIGTVFLVASGLSLAALVGYFVYMGVAVYN